MVYRTRFLDGLRLFEGGLKSNSAVGHTGTGPEGHYIAWGHDNISLDVIHTDETFD